MRKSLIGFYIILVIVLNSNAIFATNDEYLKINSVNEDDIINFVLGENGLNVLSRNVSGEIITKDQMVDMLINYSRIYDDYNATLLTELYEPVISVDSMMSMPQNPYGYADYRMNEEKEKNFLRLFRANIVGGSTNGLFYPDNLCTWEEARKWIIKLVDRTNRAEILGYEKYLERYLQFEDNLEESETEIYSAVKKLLFYNLFSVSLQRDYSKHGDYYYEYTSDMLQLLHNKYYKIGCCFIDNGGIIIDNVFYKGDTTDLEEGKNVLCIYEKNKYNEICCCITLDDVVCKKIRAMKTARTIDDWDETTERQLMQEPNVDAYLKYESDFEIEYPAILNQLKISVWQDNLDNTITRAQVVKTAIQMGGNNFNRYKPYKDLPFIDVEEDTRYYNYINAAYSAGAVVGYEDGLFYPDKPCSYGEAIKILSYMTGWGGCAEEKAKENGENPYPEYYINVLKEINVFDFNLPYSETNIKQIFPELVWNFMNIPVLEKSDGILNEWTWTPSLYMYRR